MSISYKDAGVNIDVGTKLVSSISKACKATHTPEVLKSQGNFAALYDMSAFEKPVLVSGTDGVGTKMLIAIQHNDFTHIGQDCVGMCVNDILCHGAKPLFFLDYLACGVLELDTAHSIIEGIARACKECGCSLVGGETAEMPGMYKPKDYDVAGFAVGVVNKDNIIDGSSIGKGDVILGCPSNGLHSNGFSLVRALFPDTNQDFLGRPLYTQLLCPTRLYVNAILSLIDEMPHTIKGLAHITGGGMLENIPRIIPDSYEAVLYANNIPQQDIFTLIQNTGKVEENDLWNTFNMGIGMVVVVDKNHADAALSALHALGEHAVVLGEIISSNNHAPIDMPIIAQGEKIWITG